jgi:hypothetical protein
MKTAASFALSLLMWVSFSQVSVAHEYYPLALGNEWFYRAVGLPTGDSTIDGSVRVVGDTVLSNGQRYFVLSQDDIMGGRFVRTDSTYVFYFNPYTGQEQRVFKLNGQIGDTTQISWGPYAIVRVSAIDTLMILGERLRIITFQVDGLLYAVMRLCERFGPMTEWRYSDPPQPWPEWGRELVGCIINGVHYGHTLDVPERTPAPESFELYQNFPNPFNPETHIAYTLWSRHIVSLRVLDITGKDVRNLVHQVETAGQRTVAWDGRDNFGRSVSSGVYLYELSTPSTRQVKRMLLLK